MVCGVEGTVPPFDSCLSVQRADVGKTKYSPRKHPLDFTCWPINSQVCKCCVIDMLCWWIFSNITPMRPPPSPWHWGLIGFSGFYQLLLTHTVLSSQFALSLFLSSARIVYLSGWQMLHETTKEKSGGNHNVQTDRSHYTSRMCGRTETDNR